MEEIDPQQIDNWKFQYGPVYQVDEFIFRGITISEYQRIILDSKLNSAEKEEKLVQAAILFPQEVDLDILPAGVVSAIAEEITSVSGFGDPKAAKSLFDDRRYHLDNIFMLMKAMILAAMPVYTEEELDAMTFPKLVDKTILAEHIIKVQQAVASGNDVQIELIDPEEEAKRAEKAAAKHTANRKPGQAVHGDPIADKLRHALE